MACVDEIGLYLVVVHMELHPLNSDGAFEMAQNCTYLNYQRRMENGDAAFAVIEAVIEIETEIETGAVCGTVDADVLAAAFAAIAAAVQPGSIYRRQRLMRSHYNWQ